MGFSKVDRRDRRCRWHISRREGMVKCITRGARRRFDSDFSSNVGCAAPPSGAAGEEGAEIAADTSAGGSRKGFEDTTT